MNERADFKESVRQLAAVVIESPAADKKQERPAAKPAVVERHNEPDKYRLRPKSTGGRARSARQNLAPEPNVVTVTTRFPNEVDALVTKASFAQRMKELSPGTKQEILVEAAREWLCRNGYLKREEPEPDESQAV
jgi:hypothetical protein